MRKLSKLVSLMLSVVLCIGMASPALAVEYDISKGAVTVDSTGSNGVIVGQTTSSRNDFTEEDRSITISQSGEGSTSNTIAVGEGVTDTTIILNGVNIDVSKKTEAAMSISGEKTDVTVELKGKNTLNGGPFHAGLELSDRGSVTITSENKGELTATGGFMGAGIGSGKEGNAGNITIEGDAQVTATGNFGAGIGGGYECDASNITIRGDANVTAQGGSDSAGIGSGYGNSKVTSIHISDNAAVKATGGEDGAGIGGGHQFSGDTNTVGSITIDGAKEITAQGGKEGAGIGGGQNSQVDSITITGAKKITAQGGEGGAGIGGGDSSRIGDIAVFIGDDEEITARGGKQGAGIGSGYGGSFNSVSVLGADHLIAQKGEGAEMDIGEGYRSWLKKIDVQLVQEDGTLSYQGKAENVFSLSEYVVSLPEGQKFTTAMMEDLYNGKPVSLPAQTTRTDGSGTTVYPEGTTLRKSGGIDPNSLFITTQRNADGALTKAIRGADGQKVEVSKTRFDVRVTTVDGDKVTADRGSEIRVDEENVITVVAPAGTSIKDANNQKAVYPYGAVIYEDGTIISTNVSDIDESGAVTVTTTTKPVDGNETKVETTVIVPEGGQIVSTPESNTKLPDGSIVQNGDDTATILPKGGTIDKGGEVTGEVVITVPANATINDDGTITIPEGGKVTDKDGKVTDLPFGGEVDKEGNVTAYPDPNPPVNPPTADDPGLDVPMGDGSGSDTAATIADQEVPLAGLVSRQILVSALYVHEGSPDGEDAEGEYTKALAWAIANGIIDQESDPEEVVTAAILRDVMTRYAKFLDVIFDVEIPGEDDEIVMNCNEILEKFFAELEDKAA